jgi:NCAIR mutase (PurE)-related protein
LARATDLATSWFVVTKIQRDDNEAIQLLEKFRAGKVERGRVLRAFQSAPLADLGFAQVDTHRALRKGFPEVIFGSGKTPDRWWTSPRKS